MFGSAVLDLAIGLVFSFLTVSLATGTVVEAISSITKWRAKTLRKGIGELLNDPQLRGSPASFMPMPRSTHSVPEAPPC
jgi:hypothetical protein